MAQPATARDLTTFLDTLRTSGEYRPSQLAALSDLNRDDVVLVQQAWSEIPVEVRRRVIAGAVELAEDNVHLDFTRLARVALDDPDATVRRSAAESLWESVDRDVVRRLATMVREDPEHSVRAAAAVALRAAVLEREFETLNTELGDTVVDALREAAASPQQPANVRARALESLGPRSLPWVKTLIADGYYSDVDQLRLAAIHAMGASADASWFDYLEEQLGSDDPAFRFEAATALGTLGMDEGIEPLTALLDDEDVEVAFAAITGLGEIGGREAVEILRGFAENAPEVFTEVLDAAIENASFLAESGGGE